MTALIRADLRRILRKKGFWIWNVLFVLFLLIDILRASESTGEEIMAAFQTRLGGRFLLIIVLYIYLSVSGDDEKSNAMVCVIGRGMKKGTFLLAKLLDGTLLAGLFYAVLMAVQYFFFSQSDPPLLTQRQIRLLMVYCLFMLLRAIWCLAFAMLAQYATGSTAPAILSIVATAALAGPLLKVAQEIYRIGLYDYLPDGLLEAAFKNLCAGSLPWQLLPVAVLYIGGTMRVVSAIFEKKELEL